MSEGSAQGESSTTATAKDEVKVDEQQQKRLQKYVRATTLITLLGALSAIAIGLFMMVFVVAPALSGRIESPWLAWQPVQGWYPLEILALYVQSAALMGVLLFLFSLLSGYILPRRYQLSTRARTFSEWAVKWLRLNGRRFIAWLLILQGCSFYIAVQPLLWWLWMAILLALASFIRMYFAPLFAFRHMRRAPLNAERMRAMLNKLCVQNKINIRHFFVLSAKKPGQVIRANAYMAGWGKTSSMLLTDGLLKNFLGPEIKVIVAHELGHHIYRTLIKKQALNFSLLFAEFFLYNLLYHWFFTLSSFPAFAEPVELAGLLLSFFALVAIEVRLISLLIRRKYSRRHEFLADEFALRTTLNVPAFKNAMVRLGNVNDIPFKLTRRQERGLTHPTTMRRLQHADEFASRLAKASEAPNKIE